MSQEELKTRARRSSRRSSTRATSPPPMSSSPPTVFTTSPAASPRPASRAWGWLALTQRIFPDFHAVVEDEIAEGDRVVQRITCYGTHQGEFSGIRPTGEQVTFPVIEINRAGTDGKFAEHWSSADLLGVLHRLTARRPRRDPHLQQEKQMAASAQTRSPARSHRAAARRDHRLPLAAARLPAGQPGRQHRSVRRPARPGRAARAGHRRLPVRVGLAAAAMKGAGPTRRRAVRISAGTGAAVVVAAVAGVALTFLAADDFKGNDLVFNLATLASSVAYAALGALVVRRAGSLIGWLMLAEGAGLALITLASTYCLLGIAASPVDLPAARPVGTLAESGFAPVDHRAHLLAVPDGNAARPALAGGRGAGRRGDRAEHGRPGPRAAAGGDSRSGRGLGDLRQPARHVAATARADRHAQRAERRVRPVPGRLIRLARRAVPDRVVAAASAGQAAGPGGGRVPGQPAGRRGVHLGRAARPE